MSSDRRFVQSKRGFYKPFCPKGHDKRIIGITNWYTCKKCARDLTWKWAHTFKGLVLKARLNDKRYNPERNYREVLDGFAQGQKQRSS